jgi:predicted RNA-binding Zn ribbon-like protein
VTVQPETWDLEEGHLVLDFINTAYLAPDESDPWGYRTVDESLTDLAALASWASDRAILSAEHIAALQTAPDDPAVIAHLHVVREAVRRVMRAHVETGPDASAMLDLVNRDLLPAASGTILRLNEEGFTPDYVTKSASPAGAAIESITWAIAYSAIALLTDDEELALIKECPGEDCGYLFRDSSRGRRRWCSMATCGNRAKVHRFRHRHPAA